MIEINIKYMKIETLETSPEWQRFQSLNQKISQKMIDVAETIAWFLGKETQNQFQESINNFNTLLNEFEEEIKTISEEIWYDYKDYEDYENKLLATEEKINKTLGWLFEKKPFLKEL